MELIAIQRFSIQSWLVEFEQDPSASFLEQLDLWVDCPSHPLCEWTVGDCSLLLIFKTRVKRADVDLLLDCCRKSKDESSRESRLHVIQMKFDGPDLSRVADFLALSEQELIDAHCSVTHHVAFMGFAPGFGYLKGSEIAALPRLESPRAHIKSGSVAVAAGYCSIYPVASAGGWNLLGTSERVLFNPESDSPFLLRPFDRVRFEPC